MGRYELFDPGDQLFDAGEAASPDCALRDDPKPALHLIEPGGVGGHVVDVEARPVGRVLGIYTY